MPDNSRNPDEILDELDVLRAQSGDAEAFRGLVNRWNARLCAYAARLTNNRDAASDVVQETWLSAAKGVKGLRDPANFRPWIYRIVQRRSADWVRSQIRERKTVRAVEEEASTVTPSDPGIEILREAIDALPADTRQLLHLHYTDGLRVREIADVLNVPIGTVKSRLFHARQNLRATLNPND